MISTRIATLDFDGSGSAASTIGVSPERYAGAYVYDGGTITGLHITNMGRDLLGSTSAATHFLQDLKLDNELLVDGEVVVSGTGTPNSTAHVKLFFHRT